MIRIEDFGEIAYGGAVTLAEWWDNKRITNKKITNKDILKKAAFYTYLGVGLTATLASVFGWMRNWERWTEKLSTGFLYDLPRFAYNLSQSMATAKTSYFADVESAAVREARQIIETRRLAAGTPAQRSYQPEFKKAMVL